MLCYVSSYCFLSCVYWFMFVGCCSCYCLFYFCIYWHWRCILMKKHMRVFHLMQLPDRKWCFFRGWQWCFYHVCDCVFLCNPKLMIYLLESFTKERVIKTQDANWIFFPSKPPSLRTNLTSGNKTVRFLESTFRIKQYFRVCQDFTTDKYCKGYQVWDRKLWFN